MLLCSSKDYLINISWVFPAFKSRAWTLQLHTIVIAVHGKPDFELTFSSDIHIDSKGIHLPPATLSPQNPDYKRKTQIQIIYVYTEVSIKAHTWLHQN